MIRCVINSMDFESVREMAFNTWPHAYGEIITKAQMDYMLEKMYSITSLQHQHEDLQHCFVIAIDETKKHLGFASFSSHSTAVNHYRLHKLYVLPSLQQKGTGKILMDVIFNEIKKNGKGSIELNVNRNNNALQFYHKLGFEITREEDIDIGNGFFMNDYVMERIVQ